ncbi:hypothetical protein KAH55_07455, partial [bacterium]|nr:hypothetical protein [bacterium]
DAPVTARLQYGLTDEYGMVLENRELTDTHSFYLFGLKSDRIYFFQIQITAPDGQENQIENAQFLTTRTLAPRVVLADTVLPIGKTFSLPIYLDTVGAIPLHQFSLTVEFDDGFISPAGISREGTLCNDWDMGINTLTASKIRITGSGNSPLLKKGRLLVIQGIVREDATPGDITSALLSQFSFNYGTEPAYTQSGQIQLIDSEWPQFVSPPQLLRTSETTAALQWTATEPASAQIMFGPDSILDYSRVVDEHAIENSVTLTDLETGIAYMAKVGLTDAVGHGPIWSPPVYFTPQANPVVLTIPETEMARGIVHELPIMIKNLAGEAISNFQLSLVFDAQLVTPIGVSSDNSLTEQWGNATFSLESKRVDISHSGNNAINQDGVLCWV